MSRKGSRGHRDRPRVVDAAFEQLRTQILELVKSERLVAGTKIPTVRGLASQLHIAPNTVARTYRELEQLGVIETRGRLGSFVAASGDPTRAKHRKPRPSTPGWFVGWESRTRMPWRSWRAPSRELTL